MSNKNFETIRVPDSVAIESERSEEEKIVLEYVDRINQPGISKEEKEKRVLELFNLFSNTDNPKLQRLREDFFIMVED